MSRYCVDANVFIDVFHRYYPQAVFPCVWHWLAEQVEAETIYSVKQVYAEIMKRDDELKAWFKNRSSLGLKTQTNSQVDAVQKEILEYVNTAQRYTKYHEVTRFMSGADSWLIARAKTDQTILVTNELPAGNGSPAIKIPDICDHFDVKFINMMRMLKDSNAKFEAIPTDTIQ